MNVSLNSNPPVQPPGARLTRGLRIGVDVGGTHTDAVLMDGARVLAAAKALTTADVTRGIVTAIEKVLIESGMAAGAVSAVMLGTTHFTNAVVERRHLTPVGVIRLGLPATRDLPPGVDWPADLHRAVCRRAYLVAGGYEYDGRDIAPLDEGRVRAVAAELGELGVEALAVSSVFAPVSAAMEERAAEILREALPGAVITLSSELGRIGLLARENATILNAALTRLAGRLAGSLGDALAKLNIQAPLFISQNDGTLMNLDAVARYPILTFASGPTNSMRGAAFLSGLRDAVVVDIGGTTADVGVLVNGFPRQSSHAVDVGGVRTSFRMPDVLSVGLGGGSIVRTEPQLSVGPDSVGYELPEKALVFGGSVCTATDVAVAAGRAVLGESARVELLDRSVVAAVLELARHCIEVAIDQVKASAADMPVVVVGGGSILIGDELQGASRVVRPEQAAVANAIGAAIAQVGGEVDRVVGYAEAGRSEALARVREEAVARAVAAGADPRTVEVAEIDEVPLAYMPGGAVRVRVKVVGDLVAVRVGEQISEQPGSLGSASNAVGGR